MAMGGMGWRNTTGTTMVAEAVKGPQAGWTDGEGTSGAGGVEVRMDGLHLSGMHTDAASAAAGDGAAASARR